LQRGEDEGKTIGSASLAKCSSTRDDMILLRRTSILSLPTMSMLIMISNHVSSDPLHCQSHPMLWCRYRRRHGIRHESDLLQHRGTRARPHYSPCCTAYLFPRMLLHHQLHALSSGRKPQVVTAMTMLKQYLYRYVRPRPPCVALLKTCAQIPRLRRCLPRHWRRR
jgi:hypothetical protein